MGNSTLISANSRRKVKSGCRTCKIRRVKCDEGWPACRTCVSTGRVCEGYGIWGGGGNRYEQRGVGVVAAKPTKTTTSHCNTVLIRKNPFPPTIRVSNTEEYLHFEFFKDETLNKLPGLYGAEYDRVWERLIIQNCAEEPAVMHAVLAISSAHRRKALDGVSRGRVLSLPDREEEFLLRNYCKSIHYLQPMFHTCGEHSLRIALITCLVFIYLELLRGDYKRGCDHFYGGTKLLKTLHLEKRKKVPRADNSDKVPHAKSENDRVDDFLAGAYARLRVQIEFCNRRGGSGSTFESKLPPDLPTFKFSSHHEARHYLDRALEGITGLSRAILEGTHATWPPRYWEIVRTERHLMQGSLDCWLRSYDATVADITIAGKKEGIHRYQILHIYQTMIGIMAATCLSPGQMIYDQNIPEFQSIVTQCKKIVASSEYSERDTCGPSIHQGSCCRACSDARWMPPLYYTALKCRVPHVRAEAVKLMSAFLRYEIVWGLDELKIASIVAEEVIRMEESEFFGTRVDEKTTMSKNLEYIQVPLLLPEEKRFDDVAMLPDGVLGNIQIECKKWNEGKLQVVRKIYSRERDAWTTMQGR